jgi:hypothetical protein
MGGMGAHFPLGKTSANLGPLWALHFFVSYSFSGRRGPAKMVETTQKEEMK